MSMNDEQKKTKLEELMNALESIDPSDEFLVKTEQLKTLLK